MGKRKKNPETDKEKELLEKQLLKMQIVESATNTIAAIISVLIAAATAIIAYFK